MKFAKWLGALMGLSLLIVSCLQRGDKMADLALINGTVWTANPSQPWAEAVAIEGDRILTVGRTAEVKRRVGKATRVIDSAGTLVVPGFIDSYTHFLKGGFSLSSIQLRDVTCRDEFVKRVEEKARELEKGEWIQEGNWDHEQFSPPELPTKEWIDSVSPDHPVCVSRYDLHMVLVNSLTLKIGGITKKTKSPEGGEILKDPKTGEPTGILRDAAIDLVTQHIPEPSLKTNLQAAEAAFSHAREFGVTSVHDMADATDFAVSLEVYQELLRQNKLTTRIYFYVPIDQMGILEKLRLKTPFGNDWLAIGGLKGFADGGLGASTAYFFEAYADNPTSFGLLAPQMFPEGIMEKRVAEADRKGLQVAIHAIGDRANAIILGIFEKVATQNGARDRRISLASANSKSSPRSNPIMRLMTAAGRKRKSEKTAAARPMPSSPFWTAEQRWLSVPTGQSHPSTRSSEFTPP
mgnify:CR=1 FL=1